jgi:aromatic ring-opening dioxygenase LigB subunit
MLRIKDNIANENPEIIILITPHGLNLDEKFILYEHNEFLGNYYRIIEKQSVVYGDLIQTKAWQGNVEFSKILKSFLDNHNIPIEGVTQGYPDYPLTLAWGESVPLFYLSEKLSTKIVILGIPRSRHTKILEMQKSLFSLGKLIFNFCKNREENISIIISGDLSHTHVEDGPYGYDPSSKLFDQLVTNWSTTLSKSTFDEILILQNTALACGMAGISMLQGISEENSLKNQFCFYDLPTYFGMIINHWKLLE